MKNLMHKLKMYGPLTFILYAVYELYLLIWMQRVKNSYSQSKEDIVIDDLLGRKNKGFYIDVGAYDPIRFSNTNRFYKRGWRGINIEPNTTCFEKIKSARPLDINLNIGIGTTRKKIFFFKFFPDTLSTFSQKRAREYKKQGFNLVDKTKIKTVKLSDVISIYCKNIPIDFFSIDTEGHDLSVLKSNDWTRFRPKLICIEMDEGSEITSYLSNIGYRQIFNNGLNGIFMLIKPGISVNSS